MNKSNNNSINNLSDDGIRLKNKINVKGSVSNTVTPEFTPDITQQNIENEKIDVDTLFNIVKNDPVRTKRLEDIIAYLKVQKQPFDDNELDVIFKRLDIDKDEKISSKEIKNFLNSLKTPVNDFHIKKMLEDFDRNGDGEITKDEFYERMNEQKNYSKKNDLNELLDIFRLFDANQDKKICEQDLLNIFRAIGENFNEQKCKEMIKLLSNNDNGINFPRFFEIIKDETNKHLYN
jgi:Ca2+-binding EF-hand superfamily protein